MKLTMVFLLAACLQVSATGYGQKVSISGTDLPLEKVFSMIKKQTGYVFFYDYSIFQGARPVSLNLKDAEVEDVLRACLQGQNLDFSITNKTISITKKAGKPVVAPVNLGNPPEVVGTVRSDNGAPLAGATVFIKKLNKSGATNALGEFVLKDVPNGKYSVEISYIGYEKYVTEILLENHEVRIVADMRLAKNSLDETVVKGYYNTTKRLNTGNVATVKGEDIEKQPVSDPLAALEGRVAGLYISQPGISLPGARFSVSLRGQNSIANGNDPLYIIDGVPFTSTSLTTISAGSIIGISPFNSLNPSDIESIEVLKDADATAIYGSRGANGVILINTRRGKIGKTKFDIDIADGSSRSTRLMNLLNTKQYLEMRHEAYSNDGTAPDDIAYDVNGAWDTTRNTNWQKTLIGNNAAFTNAQLMISGGNSNTQFSISSGYTNQGTILPGNFSDRKGSAHISLNHTSDDRKFSAFASASYINDNSNMPFNNPSSDILLAPDAPPLYDKNGNLNWQVIDGSSTWTNPLASLLQKAKAVTDNLIGDLNMSYQLLPGFQIKSSFGYKYMQMNQLNIIPLTSFPPEYSPYTFLRETDYGNNNIKTWIIEPQINYKKVILKGQLDILIGTTFQQDNSSTFRASGTDYTTDALLGNLSAASSISGVKNSSTLYRYNALFGRVSYDWQDKYLINLTARRDGSSRFGSGRQFGNFGAIGAGWIFSKEKFLAIGQPFLSFGKVRASYGTTGNDQIADYQYLSTYTPFPYAYQGLASLIPTQLSNPYYGWELDKKLEFGVELGFLKDKIQLSASYFRNRTANQLVGYSLPTVTGFNNVIANLPAIVQNTGIEFTLNTVNFKRNDFLWSSSFNITVPKNKLVSYPNLAGSSYATQYEVGQSLYIKKVYHYTGVDPVTGVYTFEDVNKDGKISSPEDNTTIVQNTQKFYGGFENTFVYKGFEIDIMFQFVKQIGTRLNNFTVPGFFANVSNQQSYVLNRWQSNGNITDVQKYTSNFNSVTSRAFTSLINSDQNYGDASFIRLKNASLSYHMPANWQQRIHVQNSKIYVQCQNLLTLTKYKGLDPENKGSLPPVRTVTIGLRLGF